MSFVNAADNNSIPLTQQIEHGTSATFNEEKINSTTVLKINLADRESPKQLPPRDQLIVLKPVKLVSKAVAESNHTSDYKVTPSTNKQREPKFVPYEPYKGATRSMTEGMIKSHSRKPSNASSNSAASVNTSSFEAAGAAKISQNNLHDYSVASVNLSSLQLPKSSEGDTSWNQGHVVMLLKERLKMHEKDIQELRTENTRLKKMLVDSMSGFGSTSSVDIATLAGSAKFAFGTKDSSVSESVENLTDELEVWRSKFLSSCVLVEQLLKQNQDWKESVNSAADIFRETKQCSDVVLTPLVFDKINSWLQLNHYSRDSRFPSGGRNVVASFTYDDPDYSNNGVSSG